MYGEKSFKLISVIIVIIGIIFGSTLFPIFGGSIQNFLQTIVPESMLAEFSDFQYSRIEIWQSGINLAINHPFFGTGASSFPEIFKYQTNLWKGHAHNLPLELMISYGIPTALMIIIPITNLTYQTARFRLFEKNRKESPIYDQAWISALIILLASQMVDVQYFDGRISIIMWFLLSGSQNILEEKYSKKK
jgi:O-antigen ligase